MDYDKLAKQFGGTIQQTSNLDDLAKQFGGSAQSMQPEKPKVSGLQSFIQDIAEPFLKLPTTVAALGAKTIALGAEAFGRPDIAQRLDKTVDEGIDYGYFGNVKPMGSLKEAFGTGAEIGSYAIGGGGAGTALKTGLKGLIGRGVKEGIATGVSSGALMGFGDSMQQAESKPMDVAYNTLFGAGVGGLAGGVLGGVTPLVSKGVKEVAKFTKVPELQTKLSEGYQKIFNPTARQIKADTRFGNNSFDFLAQEMPDTPLKVNSAGRVEADEAIEMAKMKYSAEAAAYKPIIRNSGKYIDIDEAIAVAKANAKKEFDGTDLTKAEQQIDNEVNAYLANTPQDVNVLANGKRFVTLARADDIKSYSWARGKGWGTPEAEVWNDTNNIIGHALKDAIEKQLPDAPIKAMNRRLGQWKNAIDMLERRNGQVSGSGGKLSKLFKTQTGSIVGGLIGTGTGDDNRLIGGAAGASAGFITASALAAMMSNPNVRLFAVRQLLQRLNKAGRKDMIKEAEQILQQQASKYLLPAAGKSSYVEKPIIVGKPGQRLESTGTRPVVQSSPSALQAKAPSVAPSTQDTINSNITNSVNQSVKNANLKNTQGGFIKGLDGGPVKKIHVDDKRVMKDFTDYVGGGMGKMTEKEIFELELAASRIAEKYNIKNFKSLKGLANEFGRILDDQGLDFGKVATNPLIIGAGASAAAVALQTLLKKYKNK